MKKLKIFSILSVMLCSLFLFTGCSLFKNFDAINFVVNYTIGQEFLPGEEFSDVNLRGIATMKDGSEKDVTKEMKVDSSALKNAEAGDTVKIKCSYGIFTAEFDVEVVDEITHLPSIRRVLSSRLKNSFAEKDGKLEFTASHVGYHSFAGYIKQSVSYKVENGIVKEYYVAYKSDIYGNEGVKLVELLYSGDKNTGFASYNVCTDVTVPSYSCGSDSSTFVAFENSIQTYASQANLSAYITATQLTSLYVEGQHNNIIGSTDNITINEAGDIYTVNFNNGNHIKIGVDGFIYEHEDISIVKTTNIPDRLQQW